MRLHSSDLAKTQIAHIVTQVHTFQLDRNRLPAVAEGLDLLTKDPQAAWYLEPQRLRDPWGKPYQYLVPGPGGQPFEVLTFGADGVPGGSGDGKDVSSADGTAGAR